MYRLVLRIAVWVFLAVLICEPTDSFAQRLFLRARLANESKQLAVTVTNPSGMSCSGQYIVTAHPRRITNFASVQQIQTFIAQKSGTVTRLGRIKKSGAQAYAYLTVRMNCADGKSYGRRVRVIIPTTSGRSGLSLSQWINRVKNQLDELFASPTVQNTPVPTPAPFPPPSLSLVNAFPSLKFSKPIDLQDLNDGTNRLLVAEQGGKVFAFQNNSGANSSILFLDLSSKISTGSERGLLGLAVDPNFSSNRFIYVNYTRKDDGATVVSRFTASTVARQAVNVATERIFLIIAQPYENHNGGSLQFGQDGFLYIATGDGGSGGDPHGNGQSLTTLLGKILRIDVHNTQSGRTYAIPSSNPLAGNQSGFRAEIYAYGFRNPWRISFDFPTGRFWAADVGQGAREEVDLVSPGRNYGWNRMEGTLCYPSGESCNTAGLEMPVVDYPRSLGQSVTGGYTYRGSLVPSLSGVYLYGDFVSGRIWGIRGVSPLEHAPLLNTALNISSFGRTASGEVFVIDYAGSIYRFEGR